MLAQIDVGEREQSSVDWTGIDEDTKKYIAGQIDGDGSVGVYNGGLKVSVGKAENAWHVLFRLQDMFEGSIHISHKATDNHQAVKTWQLIGRSALDFCMVMQHYTFGKQPQFAKACEHPIHDLRMMMWKPVMATSKTGQERMFGNMYAATKVLPRTCVGSIAKCVKGVKHYNTCGGYTWRALENPVKQEEVLARVKALELQLKAMKRIEHLPISVQLSLPYIAGMIDADGHLKLPLKGGGTILVSQKYRAICDRLYMQLGGSVQADKMFHWVSSAADTRNIVSSILPYLLEKKQQAVLFLSANRVNVAEVRTLMSKLKGHQKYRTKLV